MSRRRRGLSRRRISIRTTSTRTSRRRRDSSRHRILIRMDRRRTTSIRTGRRRKGSSPPRDSCSIRKIRRKDSSPRKGSCSIRTIHRRTDSGHRPKDSNRHRALIRMGRRPMVLGRRTGLFLIRRICPKGLSSLKGSIPKTRRTVSSSIRKTSRRDSCFPRASIRKIRGRSPDSVRRRKAGYSRRLRVRLDRLRADSPARRLRADLAHPLRVDSVPALGPISGSPIFRPRP